MSELLHSLEAWIMEFGTIGLFIVSFLESSFFPIPPDVFLLPIAIANPSNAWFLALIVTVGSVLGAILGWWIGKKLGRPILLKFISEEKIQKVEGYFQKYGSMAILVAGFTPIPYKVFTIFSGVTNMKIRVLVFWSIIGRGIRFFLEAALVVTLGAKAMPFIEENFTLITIIGGGILIIAYILYQFVWKKRHK
ncbi:YqaA family protein [Bacillus carboniphilus]|uniref:YqaA family protein n=1 Tax=Bacillus carboniphilus TaxID=86663 RepID=A0ABP3FRX2_9BACI